MATKGINGMSCSCKCSQERKVVKSDKAPAAIGPYSAGISVGGFVFTAGQLGVDPSTGNLVGGGIESETRQALTNIAHILEAAETSLKYVVKTTVFLRDINEFQKMNAVYAEFFPVEPPARSTIQVAALPKAGAVEIEVVALLPPSEPGCNCGDESNPNCECGGHEKA